MPTKKKQTQKEVVGKVELPSYSDIDLLENPAVEDIIKELIAMAKRKVMEKAVLNRLMGAFTPVEKEKFRVSDIVMCPISYSSVRKLGREHVDPETKAANIKKGLFGTIWGARIWVSRRAPGVSAYRDGSKLLSKHFPEISKAKKEMLIDN